MEREAAARSGFALFPIGMLVAVAVIYRGALRPDAWNIGVLALLAALLLSPWVGARVPRLFGVLVLGLALGFLACRIELGRTQTTVFSGEATVRLTGTVIARETDERGRIRYGIEIASTDRPVLSRPPERARILVSSRHEPLPIGSTYKGLVRLRPPAGPAFPGAHDFAYAAYFDGLGAYGFALGAPEAPGAVRSPTFGDRIAALRLSMSETIRAALPGPTGAVAAALITGERAGIPDDINEDLRVTGLSHVLSISGFHMALVAGFFMLATRSVLAAVPAIALRWPVKKLAALFALAATGFYFLLAGDNAATERSFVMIAIMLGAILLDRPALTLRNVALAAVVVVALAPHVVLTATFQMSFAATAALVGAYGAYARWRATRGTPSRGWLDPRWIGILILGTALSSLIAGAATAPFAVYHFQRAAPFSLIANVVATPIFSFWIMPLGMLSVLAMPFGLQGPPLQAMGWGLDLVFALAARFADAFPDYPTGLMSGAALIAFSAAILIASFCASTLRWTALVPVLVGLATLSAGPPPELLVFESGRDLALVNEDGALRSMRPRPSAFVWDQWRRAYPAAAEDDDPAAVPQPPYGRPEAPFVCEGTFCRATTRSGIRIGWSDDYERLDELCRTSDVAIMARAVRATTCRDGGTLVTLRNLRQSGSLAVSRDEDGGVRVSAAIPPDPQEWNRHRHAPWPEYWRREQQEQAGGTPGAAPDETASDSAGSARPASPEP